MTKKERKKKKELSVEARRFLKTYKKRQSDFRHRGRICNARYKTLRKVHSMGMEYSRCDIREMREKKSIR